MLDGWAVVWWRGDCRLDVNGRGSGWDWVGEEVLAVSWDGREG